MSWLQKLLPPRIKRGDGSPRKAVPEGLWSKCESCEAVLYRTDLEKNHAVCPKCSHHARITARERIAMLLDAEGQHEIGAEVTPLDPLKFKDSRRYPDRLREAENETDNETHGVPSAKMLQGSRKAIGGPARIRTLNPLLRRQMLYPLSYGTAWRRNLYLKERESVTVNASSGRDART